MRETATQLQMVTIAHASKDSKDPTAIVSNHASVATFASYIEKVGATYAQQNKYFLAGISQKKNILENLHPVEAQRDQRFTCI